MNFQCSAILFDLDGVLVDSTRSVARQWRLWAEENNIDPEKVLAIAHGRRTIEVVQILAPHLDAKAEESRIEKREADDIGRWCVVTSGTRYLATSRLRFAQLPIPRVLVAADDVQKGKPDPEPYLKGAELLEVKPAECLVIEDAPAGIRSARAGGMKAIALTSTYPQSELREADAILQNLGKIQVRGVDGERRLQVDIL